MKKTTKKNTEQRNDSDETSLPTKYARMGLLLSLIPIAIFWSACIIDFPDIFSHAHSCDGVPFLSAVLLIGFFIAGYVVGYLTLKVKR